MAENDCPESGLKTPLKNITRDFHPLVHQVYFPWTKIFNGTPDYRATYGMHGWIPPLILSPLPTTATDLWASSTAM
jgi:hypothetical protein